MCDSDRELLSKVFPGKALNIDSPLFMMKKPHPLVLPQLSRSTTVLVVVMAEMSFHS